MDKELNISALEQKIDQILTISEDFKLKQESVQDLARDLNYVSNSVIFSLQEELELENVKIDGRDLRELMILLMKNINNLNQALRQMDALTDLGKETGQVIKSLLLDFTDKAAMLEEKGYFKISGQVMAVMDKFMENLPDDTMRKMENAAPKLAEISSELSDEKMINQLAKMIKMRKMIIPAIIVAWAVPVGLLVINLFV
ncbi:MAG: hypothetical protein ABR542_02120 [Desulfonatronovibrio sp.]|nr:hypothetical protein [Desulfovibrionales bacterium]